MRLAETKLVYKRLDQKRRGDNKLISPRQSVAIPSISDKHAKGIQKRTSSMNATPVTGPLPGVLATRGLEDTTIEDTSVELCIV